jgi:hypothetical protein
MSAGGCGEGNLHGPNDSTESRTPVLTAHIAPDGDSDSNTVGISIRSGSCSQYWGATFSTIVGDARILLYGSYRLRLCRLPCC